MTSSTFNPGSESYTPGPDPLVEFNKWFEFVKSTKEIEPAAMSLATISNNTPHIRTVLLKGLSQDGFCFFTNYESDKAKQIEINQNVSLCFHWKVPILQVRIEGRVEKLTRAESEEYFVSRPRGSQISAWASRQSHQIQSRQELKDRWKDVEKEFADQVIPCPPFWGGYRVLPVKIEFWIGRVDRLHDRFLYVKNHSAWKMVRLCP